MRDEQKQVNDETVIFRAPRSAVKSLDRMAQMIGSNRSEVLRRLIPDLTPRKELRKCSD
ncbi:MAG: ribbon-helix-helix protein, CopG family [Phycisphaerae bacterium]|nr:ribbon-helix-helix protein, CopG family [Phycisphaerae bacterium]